MRNHEKPRNKRAILRELFNLGIGVQKIAELTGQKPSTVNNDLRDSTASPNRPTRPTDVFVAVLRCYAEKPESEDLRRALAEWLREGSMLALLRNIAYAFGQVEINSQPKQEGYARLTGEVLALGSAAIIGPTERRAAAAERWWKNALIDIRDGRGETPTSHECLSQLLLRRASAEQRNRLIPTWDENLFKRVDEALATLNEKSRLLLIESFGLNGTRKPMKTIAGELGVSAPCVHQRRRVALEELHRATLPQQLQAFGMPVERAFRHERTKRELLEEALKLLPAETNILNPTMLFRSVRELDVPLKTVVCLKYANTRIVGELIQWNESGLLRVKNFGRKSLTIIKEALQPHGLTLGMELSKEMNKLFDRYRRQVLR